MWTIMWTENSQDRWDRLETKEEVMQAYDVLKEDCTIIYPVHSTTYSSCTVSLIDKFGFRWVLMTEQTER